MAYDSNTSVHSGKQANCTFAFLLSLSKIILVDVRRSKYATAKTHSRRLATIAIPCLVASLLLPERLNGQAFRNLDNAAAATAQGGAFAAQADDASAIQYNPAGMTQLTGVQLLLGTNLVSASATFTSTNGEIVRGGSPGTIANPPPSNLYLTVQVPGSWHHGLHRLTVGVGISAPFGLQVRYPDVGPLSTVLTYAALPLLDIKPTLAVKLSDHISIGGGLDVYTFTGIVGGGKARLKRLAGPEFGPLDIPLSMPLEANGSDSAVGFNVSGLITPLRSASGKPRLNVGLIYRSSAGLDLKGDFLVNGVRVAGAVIPVKLPWVVTGALAVWPVRNDWREFKLEVDVDYVDWSSFQNSNLTLSNGVTIPFPRNWQTAYVFMFGAEYRWLSLNRFPNWEIVARSGYIHGTTPVPESTFDPAVPHNDSNAFSVGMGLRCRDHGAFLGLVPCGNDRGAKWLPKAITLDLTYQAVRRDLRQIRQNVNPLVIGHWDSFIHVGAINLGVHF